MTACVVRVPEMVLQNACQKSKVLCPGSKGFGILLLNYIAVILMPFQRNLFLILTAPHQVPVLWKPRTSLMEQADFFQSQTLGADAHN